MPTYRARAWWGDELVADTSSARFVDDLSVLAFPRDDVRLDRFHDAGDGTFSIDGTVDARSSADWFDPEGAEAVTGEGVLRDLGDGHVAFDHGRARVEVDDGDVVRRLPVWGDAAHLIDILDVRPDGEGRYVSVTRADDRRSVVEGSQMLGQCIVAAGRHAPGRRAVSAHIVLMRAADASQPLGFEVDELTTGRTFTTLTVQVSQDGRRCATCTLLLDVTSPDVIRHEAPPPDIVGPADAEPYDMSVLGRDIRVVEGAYTGDPDAPVGPPVLDSWVRFADVPDDPYLHAALLAQFTGHLSIAAALRPHAGIGQAASHRTLSTAINAIALSLHADVRADRWMLYRHLSTFAGDGMTHSECRVHDEAGHLLASFSVDAMVRAFEGGTRVDHRTAL